METYITIIMAIAFTASTIMLILFIVKEVINLVKSINNDKGKY